jgi:hypothetical protein
MRLCASRCIPPSTRNAYFSRILLHQRARVYPLQTSSPLPSGGNSGGNFAGVIMGHRRTVGKGGRRAGSWIEP